MNTGFFEESPGVRSWTRLAGSYLLLLASYVIINSQLKNTPTDYTLVIFLISTAIAGKLVQKSSETNNTKIE